jgi:hypothetical protein
MAEYYMVLNDGETFTGLKGCKIVAINNVPDDVDIDTLIKDGEDEEIPDATLEVVSVF